MRPRSTPRVLPAQTDLGFAPLSPTQRPTAASGPSSNIPMIPTATLETMCASAARRTATPAPIATMALVAAVPTLCPTIIAQASTRSAIAVAGSLRPGNPARQKVRQPAHRARVLEVRIQSPPAASLLRINSAADRPAAGAAHVSIRSAGGQMRKGTTAEVRLDQGKATSSSDARPAILGFRSPGHPSWATFVVRAAQKQDHGPGRPRNLENVG